MSRRTPPQGAHQSKLTARIKLVRSERQPKPAESGEADEVVENAEWVRTLTPYADEFAEKRSANRVALIMVNPDDKSDTVFVIRERRVPLLIDASTFIVHKDEVYKVSAVKPDKVPPFLDLICYPLGSYDNMKGEGGITADGIESAPPRDTSETNDIDHFSLGEEDA